jgi:hypothetical protein
MGSFKEPSLGKRFLEKLQDEHCDETRNTEKRFRVLRNVGEAAPYFPINEPVLCYGSGDGFEVQVWSLLGFEAYGYDISSHKNKLAQSHGVEIKKDIKANVYCAHTLEHLYDRDAQIKRMISNCISTVCFIFPIEPNGSKNPSHLSPIKSINDIVVPMNIMVKYERWNDEKEGIIIAHNNVQKT